MPSTGVPWMPHADILSFEEILRLMRISTQLGFRRFRITGGEPLVRKGILDFLEKGAQIPGVDDLMLTTNGLLLPEILRVPPLPTPNFLSAKIASSIAL